MARTTKGNPTLDNFLKLAPSVFSTLHYHVYARLCRIGSDSALDTMINEISAAGVNISRTDVERGLINLSPFYNELDLWFQQLGRDTNYGSYVKILKQGSNYVIRVFPDLRGVLVLSRMSDTFPFSNRLPSSMSKEQVANVVIAALKETGLYVGSTPAGLETTILAIDDNEASYTMGQESFGGPFRSHQSKLPDSLSANNAYYSMKHGVEVKSVGDDFDMELQIRPFYEILVGPDTIKELVETEDKSAIPFLLKQWATNVAQRVSYTNSSRGYRHSKVVDPRYTLKQLDVIVRTHGNIKPRVNGEGFAVSTKGLPIFIPNINRISEYMAQLSKVTTNDRGEFAFEERMGDWDNSVLMTDWMNDILVYTDAAGSLRIHRMLGYTKMTPAADYVFLNSAVISPGNNVILSTLTKYMDGIVTFEEAIAQLPQELRESVGSITFTGSISQLISPTSSKLAKKDSGHLYDSDYAIRFKHLIGLDLEELGDMEGLKRACAIVQAYFKAARNKRKSIKMPVMSRIHHLEYLMVNSTRGQDWFETTRKEAIEVRDKNRPQPLLQEIDLPNMSVGENGNLKGWMPHQVRVVSNQAAGPIAGALDVATGGGKSLLSLSACLINKMNNPKQRVIVFTKPRLIKNTVSEINFFTGGKMNVLVLSPRNIRYMKHRLKIKTAEQFFDYVKGLPDNTIFLSAYSHLTTAANLFDDLDTPTKILDTDIGLSPFLQLLRMLNFEFGFCDESHLIKNFDAARSMATYSAMVYAERRQLASGTMNSNTVLDLVGQGFAINPMMYTGDKNIFMDRFGLSSPIIKDDEDAARIKKRMSAFAQVSSAYKKDWSFVNPDLKEEYLIGSATPLQSEFYNKLLEEAALMLKEMTDKKKIIGDGAEDDGDDEEEPETAADFDDEDSFFIRAAEVSLAKAEQFLLAPDTNEQYLTWEKRPSGQDLVSPAVEMVDRQFDRIFAQPNGDYSKEKAAVFGIHKVVSAHFVKHSRWKSRMIHYTSGDEEAIRKFKTDGEIYILCADSTSLREGENLQLLSHIFTLQPPWAPGDDEQLKSRMYRPDPKMEFNKDFGTQYWCLINRADGMPGMSQIKLARMISKAISVARLKYGEEPLWKNISGRLDDLDLISMSMDFLFASSQNSIAPYMSAWKDFGAWEQNLNRVSRIELARELELANPDLKLVDESGKVIDRALFVRSAMREAKSTKTIPGSRRAYTPWEPGSTPADPYKMGLRVLGTDEINVGDYVMTEYGPAIVQRVNARKLIIETYGMKKVTVFRSSVSVPSKDGKAKLEELIKNPAMWRAESDHAKDFLARFDAIDPSASMAPVKATTSKTKAVQKPQVKDDVPRLPNADLDEKMELDELDVHTFLINTIPHLLVTEDVPALGDRGWHRIAPFLSITFNSWKVCEQFIDKLADRYYIEPQHLESLMEEIELLRAGRALTLNKAIPAKKLRQFQLDDHRKMKAYRGTQQVRPYFIAFDRGIRLVFSRQAHETAVLTYVKRMAAKNAGKIKTPVENPGFWAFPFSSFRDAMVEVRALGKRFDMSEEHVKGQLQELKEDLKELRQAAQRPDM